MTTAQFTADRKALIAQLRTAQRIKGFQAKTRLDINGSVELLTADSEVSLRQSTDWNREGDLAAVIDAKQLQGILSKLKSSEITLQIVEQPVVVCDEPVVDDDGNVAMEQTLFVTTGKARFELPTADLSEFPTAEEFNAKSVHVVDSGELRRVIDQVAFAADTESTRYALGGVYVELQRDQIEFAATDSRRLSFKMIPAEIVGEFYPIQSGVIPSSAFALLKSKLPKSGSIKIAIALSAAIDIDDDDDAPMGVAEFLIETADWSIRGRQIDGRFPKVHDVIPANHNQVLDFDTAELLEACETALICTNEESRGCDFTIGESEIVLSTKTIDGPKSEISVAMNQETANVDLEPFTVDPRFVIEYLKSIDAPRVFLWVIDHEKPLVFRAENCATYVVMPLTPDR